MGAPLLKCFFLGSFIMSFGNFEAISQKESLPLFVIYVVSNSLRIALQTSSEHFHQYTRGCAFPLFSLLSWVDSFDRGDSTLSTIACLNTI
jgi:hypothetical protein